MNIEEIAYLLGFSDRGTFSRAFKSWTGKRPTEWRAEQVHSQDVLPPADTSPPSE